MAIITWTDVINRYPELSKLPDVSSTGVQDNMIALAEGQVHSRLGVKYTVPFSSSNYTAKDLCVDTLFVQQRMAKTPELAKVVKEGLDERVAALLNGAMAMVTSAGSSAATMVGDTVWSSTENYPPVFGMDEDTAFFVSSSQLTDEEDAR